MSSYDICVYQEGTQWVLKNCSGVEECRADDLDKLLEKATKGLGRNDLRVAAIRQAIEEAGKAYNA